MTLAHQAEVLDDHACDLNHKKLLGIIEFLAHCHILAAENLEEAKKYLNQLTQAVDPLAIQHWTEEIEHVEVTRLMNPAGMDIYEVTLMHNNGVCGTDMVVPEDNAGSHSPTQLWLEMALLIEEKQ